MAAFITSLIAAAVLFAVVAFATVAGFVTAVVYVVCELAGIKGRKDK